MHESFFLSHSGIKVNDKNLSNKLKQASPKTTTESDSFSMPNYSPKSASPKVAKQTKQTKANTSTSTASTATSPKSQQQSAAKQQSSLKFKSLNTAGTLLTSLKATTSPISISPPTSASPLSPKQNPLLTAKTLQAKKNNKGSLNAVIDKLRVNATTSNSDDSSTGSLGSSTLASGLQSSSGSSAIEIIFKNDLTNKSENKLTTSPAGSLSSKLNESKIKYNRPEFTVKQSGALKFTVTKTTKSPSVEQTKTKVINKLPVSGIKNLPPSSSTSTSSLFAQQKQSSTNKTSTGIKRQLNTSNFKLGIQQGNKGGSTTKSLSPESADQILEAALPKIQLDKLPKIPKTLNSQFNSQQNQQNQPTASAQSTVQQQQIKNNLQAKFLQQQQLKLQQQQQQNLLLKQQSNSFNSLNNNFRKYGSNQRTIGDQLNQTQDGNVQMARTTADYGNTSSSNAQPKTTINNENHQSIASSSQQSENESQSGKADSSKSISNKQFNAQNNNKPITITSTKSVTVTTTSTLSSVTTVANPSSTPSSPMECNVIPDVYQKSPPLIPTETIEETTNTGSSSSLNSSSTSGQFQKTKNVFDLPSSGSSNVQKKNTSTMESTIAKLSEKQQPSITAFNLTSTSKLLTQSSKVFLEDDDDEERLFIDVSDSSKKNTSATSNSSSTTPTKVNLIQTQI